MSLGLDFVVRWIDRVPACDGQRQRGSISTIHAARLKCLIRQVLLEIPRRHRVQAVKFADRAVVRGSTFVALTALSACTATPPHRGGDVARPSTRESATAPATFIPRIPGGYYLDDGPGDNPPANLDLLPDPIPRVEKLASGANRPYNVFGVDYVPDVSWAPYKKRGVGSWYGRKFHGQRTSSGEIYDMYAMTAAHPTLPIPCYALVTNVQNGRSVIVRVNDRGPFLHNRIMDLSYAAAIKLGYLSSGSELIEVELLMPADIAAGRIPITTNSVLMANAANGSRSAPIVVAASTPPPPLPVEPIAPTPLAASYAERGIPPDLIPDAQLPAALPEIATNVGFFLQLGAFRVRAGADVFAAHIARQIDPSIASKIQVADTNGLFRVRVGPYAQRGDADGAAMSLRAAIAQPVVVVPEGRPR